MATTGHLGAMHPWSLHIGVGNPAADQPAGQQQEASAQSDQASDSHGALGRRPASSEKIIHLLFIALVVLQALDLHSTLLGVTTRTEQNWLILWLATHVGFTSAMMIMKAFAMGALLGLYVSWRKVSGQFDKAYMGCLIFMVLVSGLIVINNYSG